MKRPHFLPRLASFELAWTDAAFDAIYPEPPRSLLPHGVASMHSARFQVHGVAGLHVVDSCVFPTNLGVNPQHSIMAMSRLAATRIAERTGPRARARRAKPLDEAVTPA